MPKRVPFISIRPRSVAKSKAIKLRFVTHFGVGAKTKHKPHKRYYLPTTRIDLPTAPRKSIRTSSLSVHISPAPISVIQSKSEKMSYNGIGLKTPRGSGTNGYVQRNLGHLQFSRPSYEQQKQQNAVVDLQRPPNEEILEHDRKRAIEVKVAEWAEAQGLYDQK
jgi:hypothetical protein